MPHPTSAGAGSPLLDPSPESDARLARRLAYEAGAALMSLRRLRGQADPPMLKAEGDRLSHDLLTAALHAARPNDAVLSEEAPEAARDDAARLGADRVWIIDPLDGTREYGEAGRDDWAVHVALWVRAERTADASQATGYLAAGAISLPARGVILGTDPALTCPAERPAGPIRVAVSRTRPPALLEQLSEFVDLDFVPMGSAGVKIAAVLLDEVDAYIHAGGQYEWDSAAPVAVALAAGAHASRLDGRPLEYNRTDPTLPDLLVCRPSLAAPLLVALSEVVAGSG